MRGLLRRLRIRGAGHARQLHAHAHRGYDSQARTVGSTRAPCPTKATPRAHARDHQAWLWCQGLAVNSRLTQSGPLLNTLGLADQLNSLLITPQDAPRRTRSHSTNHVAHPAPDETPAAHLAAASITLPVHAWRHRCGNSRAWRGDAAHEAAAATRCPRRRDEAVRSRDVQRHGGHVASDRRTAGRALVRSA